MTFYIKYGDRKIKGDKTVTEPQKDEKTYFQGTMFFVPLLCLLYGQEYLGNDGFLPPKLSK